MYSFLSDNKNKVLKEIDHQKGFLELDFSDQTHYQFFIEQVGGLDNFKKENPEMMPLLKKLKKHKNFKKRFFRNDGYHEGPDDLMGIENLIFRQTNSGSMETSASDEGTGFADIKAKYIRPKKRIKVITEFYDVTNGKLLNTLAEYTDNTDSYKGTLTGDYPSFYQDTPREFLITSTFYCTEETSLKKSSKVKLNAYVTKSNAFALKGNNEMIKSFTLNAPVITEENKKDPNHKEVLISYLREGVIPNYDVSVPFDPFFDNNNEKILVRIPFSVTVEVNDGFWISGLSKDFGYDLWITNMITGQVRSYANLSDIDQKKEAFNNKNQCKKMTFTFPLAWNNILDFSKIGYQPYSEIDFYGSFRVMIEDEYSSLPVGVSVKSDGSIFNMLNIQCAKLKIQWGCFAKDTRITLPGGAEKEAQHLHVGDRIMTASGKNAVITNIYKGYEENIGQITTAQGHSIKVTKDHTIYTEKGLLPARDVIPGMKIRTENGLETVTENISIAYQDDVYNFEFNQSEVILGNGIYIGDLALQNSIKELTVYED